MWSFFSRDPSKDFNYEIISPIEGPYDENSIWKLHSGKRKNTQLQVSVFTYDIKKGNEIQLEIAKASVKRLKTLRHPNVTMYLDSLETDKMIYLVTEYVEPLVNHLHNNESNEKQHELEISWGLHQISKAINFLVNDCNLVHNNVCIWSILKNQAGEWKLGGLEYVCLSSEAGPIKILSQLEKYNPPEKSDSNNKRKIITPWVVDMWGLGCLIWEVFNGTLVKPASLKNPGKIPKSLVAQYCELVSANPSSRPNPTEFLRRCRSPGGYFNNDFINTLLFLEEIQVYNILTIPIKDATEKTRFFNHLSQQLDNFPTEICKYKILPQLINAYEFGNAGSVVLSSLFKLGKLLDNEDYQQKIVPCVVKLFSSTDRATRARLLQQLEHFVDHLQPAIINDQIFPKILQGFVDTNPAIRENTAMLHLAPKLNYNNLNVELMKHFSCLQAKDEQGGIRTNTTVCLGKIAHFIHPQMRQKILITAFTRAMKDSFPPAKTAGILALAATQAYYPLSDIARQVIPALSCACVDSDKSVRDQAFKTIKGFLEKLEKVSENPSLADTMEAEVNSIALPTAVDTAASWAGWANKTTITTAPSDHETDNAWGDADNWGDEVTFPSQQSSSIETSTTTFDEPEFVSINSDLKPVSSYNWSQSETKRDNFFDNLLDKNSKTSFTTTNSTTTNSSTSTGGWDIDEPWDSVDAANDKSNKREEKKMLREKELQDKRAARHASGAMKLGSKKKQHQV
uniref:N-terminal kinase-like protein n=1 Tax=Strigamia maritima TaxID=126957 RepID=T1J9K5_STRMM